jgi:hypothetical protein
VLSDARAFDRDLDATIMAETEQPVHPSVIAFAERIIERVGQGVIAVLFYGSCLRRNPDLPPDEASLLDFYVLVDRYRSVYPGWLPAVVNTVLPPNVFYAEETVGGQVLRAKYAVISLRQFQRGVSRRSVQPALWARFAQPTRIIHCRSAEAHRAIRDALVTAMRTLTVSTLPLMEPQFRPADLWTRAFRETYRAELRAERPQRVAALYTAVADRYERCTLALLEALEVPNRLDRSTGLITLEPAGGRGSRLFCEAGWAGRRFVGKVLNVLRLGKAIFTFEGSLAYVLWKVRRHSGVELAVTPWHHRHPLLCSPVIAWRLYRRGAFR